MSKTPKRLGKYEILEEIGRGGFAVVYKARDAQLDRVVALKVLHPYWSADPGFAARFRREARAAANLRHPNIVTVYETGEADGQLYIAMAYLPGPTLGQLLAAEGALPLEQALPILQEIAEALDHAHAQGVVHRDVKPANVIVEETPRGPQATLMDFGLVKAMEGSVALTSQGTLLGSPEYMAPEQADPEQAAEAGPAADRYALGIVAYHILAGRVPFPGNTPATLNAHLNLDPPNPQAIGKDVTPHVAKTLLKMLAKAPADRYPTATAFVTELRRVLQAEREPRPPLPTWAWIAGGVAALALAVALVLVVLGGGGEQDKARPSATFESQGTATSEPAVEITPTAGPTALPASATTTLPPLTPTPTSGPPPGTAASPPGLTPLPGTRWTRPADEMVMVYVPRGEFQMGSTAGDSDEQPLHTVALDGFWIDRTEVTNAQYQRCVEAGSCQAPTICEWGESTYGDASKADHPVVCVDWYGAKAYCGWAGGRLPTEAEWEYAARGPQGYTYPWGNDPPTCRLAHFADCAAAPVSVDSLPDGASWCDALGMAGNVLEWVADWYADYPSAAQTNPTGPDTGNIKVLRGGDSSSHSYNLRAADRRGDLTPDNRGNNTGFRCVGLPGE